MAYHDTSVVFYGIGSLSEIIYGSHTVHDIELYGDGDISIYANQSFNTSISLLGELTASVSGNTLVNMPRTGMAGLLYAIVHAEKLCPDLVIRWIPEMINAADCENANSTKIFIGRL